MKSLFEIQSFFEKIGLGNQKDRDNFNKYDNMISPDFADPPFGEYITSDKSIPLIKETKDARLVRDPSGT